MATFEEVKNIPNHPEKYLIDVRSKDEINETGSLPASINIPLPELENSLKLPDNDFKQKYKHDKPTQDSEIIFSCKAGGRAKKATDLAQSLGYKKSKPYMGSWTEWIAKQ